MKGIWNPLNWEYDFCALQLCLRSKCPLEQKQRFVHGGVHEGTKVLECGKEANTVEQQQGPKDLDADSSFLKWCY